MFKLYRQIKKTAVNNLKGVFFEGFFVTIILSFLVLIIAANTLRVFTNGQGNYATFLTEQQDLQKLQSKNQSLKSELSYVTSDEYKELLLRDSQDMAHNDEELYNTKQKPVYFEETPQYLNVKDKESFQDWWVALLK